eukprot:gene2363-32896_t
MRFSVLLTTLGQAGRQCCRGGHRALRRNVGGTAAAPPAGPWCNSTFTAAVQQPAAVPFFNSGSGSSINSGDDRQQSSTTSSRVSFQPNGNGPRNSIMRDTLHARPTKYVNLSLQRRWLHWVDNENPSSERKGKAVPAAVPADALGGSEEVVGLEHGHYNAQQQHQQARLSSRRCTRREKRGGPLELQTASSAASKAAADDKDNDGALQEYHPGLQTHLASLGLSEATEVQLASRGVLLDGDDVIINAETGCGKTIAFLGPFLSTLYAEAAASGSSVSGGQPVRRRCVVLAPTLELCLQIRGVFNSLAAPLGVTAQLVHKREMVQVGPQTGLLVGMPRYLSGFNLPELARGCLHVVVDEADTLLRSEGQAVWQVLSQFRRLYGVRPFRGMVDPATVCFEDFGAVLDTSRRRRQYDTENPVQVIFAGATLPSKGSKSVGAEVRKCFPAIATVTTVGAHQPAAEIQHEFVDAERGMVDLKFDVIAAKLDQEVAWVRDGRDNAVDRGNNGNGSGGGGLMIVFANTHFIADVVAARLSRMGVDVALLHKRVHADAREDAMARVADGSASVLVATDLASRGLDFPHVDTVVQFDLALDVTSYLHRAGRTGRAGKPGTVLSFTSLGSEMHRQIEEALAQAGPNMQSFAELYSRNRSLRNKHRKSGGVGGASSATDEPKSQTAHSKYSKKKLAKEEYQRRHKRPPVSQVGYTRKRRPQPKVEG